MKLKQDIRIAQTWYEGSVKTILRKAKMDEEIAQLENISKNLIVVKYC